MSTHFFRYIVPLPQPDAEVMETYRVTHQFYREVHLRQEHEDYCLWYDRIAEQHRQELAQMRRELNIMGWFARKRG